MKSAITDRSIISSMTLRSRADQRDEQLRRTAKAFEASFLTEMLKLTGLDAPAQTFGGGAGEEAFSSFVAEQRAAQMTAHGGIGLSEQIFRALKRMDEN